MACSNHIPKEDGYYWVKMQRTWNPQIIEYLGGVVYITGSRERYSPYYDVHCWFDRIENKA
jgi:hypothetical protein